jgi:hypothetical protein
VIIAGGKEIEELIRQDNKIAKKRREKKPWISDSLLSQSCFLLTSWRFNFLPFFFDWFITLETMVIIAGDLSQGLGSNR